MANSWVTAGDIVKDFIIRGGYTMTKPLEVTDFEEIGEIALMTDAPVGRYRVLGLHQRGECYDIRVDAIRSDVEQVRLARVVPTLDLPVEHYRYQDLTQREDGRWVIAQWVPVLSTPHWKI